MIKEAVGAASFLFFSATEPLHLVANVCTITIFCEYPVSKQPGKSSGAECRLTARVVATITWYDRKDSLLAISQRRVDQSNRDFAASL